MLSIFRPKSKERTIRIPVDRVIKCLKTLRLRGNFDLILNESTIRTLINELSDFDPKESPETAYRAKLLAKSLREALDYDCLAPKKPLKKPTNSIQSNFNGLIDDGYGGSY